MTSATFLPRRLGEFTLVAQLSEDALGTVYRALHESEEGRFLRLRVLQSPELSPPDVLAAIEQNAGRVASLSHKTIVQHARLGLADGVPYLAWHEPAGWTLDFVLAKLRAAKRRIPLPYALLIAQRVAAALEQAWFSIVDGEPTRHGLLWPGFVSISPDAEIRVGGFGLADAALPALHKPRLAREIAPYLPPEARATGIAGESADVYSVGALLEEIVNGRRPREAADRPEPASGDPTEENLRLLLQRALASPAERFSSPMELNRALQELLAGGLSPISSIDLALFLYELLNPESRSVTSAVDGESTNPLRLEERTRTAASPASLIEPPSLAPIETPQTRRLRPGLFASAAAVLAVIVLVAGAAWHLRRRQPVEKTSAPPPIAVAAPVLAALPSAPPALESRPSVPVRSPVNRHGRRARRARPQPPAPVPAPPPETRSAAETARLGAGLARIAAERLDASELAMDAFSAARERERAGEADLRGGDTAAAQAEFGRAAGLFREAEELARQERVKRVRLITETPQ